MMYCASKPRKASVKYLSTNTVEGRPVLCTVTANLGKPLLSTLTLIRWKEDLCDILYTKT